MIELSRFEELNVEYKCPKILQTYLKYYVTLNKKSTTKFYLDLNNYSDYINNIDLVIEIDDQDHLFNNINITHLLNEYRLYIGGSFIETIKPDVTCQRILSSLYSKNIKTYRNKLNSKITYTIPLLFDLTTDQNKFLRSQWNNFQINLEFNSLNKIYGVDDGLDYTKDIKVSFKYGTGYINLKDLPDKSTSDIINTTGIMSKFNTFYQIEQELKFNNGISKTNKIKLYRDTHCMFLTFEAYYVGFFERIKSFTLKIKNGITRVYNPNECLFDNWNNIGIESPNKTRSEIPIYIIPFCTHVLNNYDNKNCQSIYFNKPFEIIIEYKIDKSITMELNKKLIIYTVNKCESRYLQGLYGCEFKSKNY